MIKLSRNVSLCKRMTKQLVLGQLTENLFKKIISHRSLMKYMLIKLDKKHFFNFFLV